MRLIDADDLIITILTHDLCDTEQIDKDILEAPTVEAIPIEWIRQKYGWLTMVHEIIADWRNENEI